MQKGDRISRMHGTAKASGRRGRFVVAIASSRMASGRNVMRGVSATALRLGWRFEMIDATLTWMDLTQYPAGLRKGGEVPSCAGLLSSKAVPMLPPGVPLVAVDADAEIAGNAASAPWGCVMGDQRPHRRKPPPRNCWRRAGGASRSCRCSGTSRGRNRAETPSRPPSRRPGAKLVSTIRERTGTGSRNAAPWPSGFLRTTPVRALRRKRHSGQVCARCLPGGRAPRAVWPVAIVGADDDETLLPLHVADAVQRPHRLRGERDAWRRSGWMPSWDARARAPRPLALRRGGRGPPQLHAVRSGRGFPSRGRAGLYLAALCGPVHRRSGRRRGHGDRPPKAERLFAATGPDDPRTHRGPPLGEVRAMLRGTDAAVEIASRCGFVGHLSFAVVPPSVRSFPGAWRRRNPATSTP